MSVARWLPVAGVICLGLAAAGFAVAATPREALGDLERTAESLRDGGLERKPVRLVEKLLSTIEKAQAVDEEDDGRFLKRLGAVMKRVDRAGKAGVDLSVQADALDVTVAQRVDGYLQNAEGLSSILQVKAHARKVGRLVERGRKALGKAEANPRGGKRTRLHARAARRLLAAGQKGELYRVEEIESGALALVVESVLLDASALTEGRSVVEGEHDLEIHVNLPVDFGAVSADMIVVERKEGENVEYFPVALLPSEDPLVLLSILPPLPPGVYTLIIRGEDDEIGPWLMGDYLVPLKSTVRIGFTIVPPGPP
ncbi:MAG: hypothetical protein ACYTDY_12180 [Planctomycetota bacterium]|jgi:hypothetical protein